MEPLCAALAVVRRRSAGGEGVEGASAGVGDAARAAHARRSTANAPANARARADLPIVARVEEWGTISFCQRWTGGLS